uniref:Putative ovule protein n=2 Tax=Solanum chacoense TaxID=4108 RepID=A0A0V0HUY8_SOLCH
MENQQWQDSQVAPSQRSVDLNVENQQWQDSQLPESSHRNLDLNVESQPVKEKQTGELVTENQDEQNRRLHAQLASYPFGDYWSDPCMEFAFKTLTGALPVEDTLAFQGSTHQEYNTSYTQADDGCFELPLFNTSSFYLNDAPNHCTPSEEHVVKEQPPLNQTFLPTGNNSIPGHSSVVSQNPGLTFLPNGNNSIPGCSSVVSQNPGLNPQAKDYQSKFKSHR